MELGGEQGRWEEERLKTASLTFGAKKEREQGVRREQERYQLLLEDDEMIEFVSTAITMKGTLTEKVDFCCFALEYQAWVWPLFHSLKQNNYYFLSTELSIFLDCNINVFTDDSKNTFWNTEHHLMKMLSCDVI